MLERQKKLFKNIIQEYLTSAKPVGSQVAVDKFDLQVSPATVRNDMVELEKLGLLCSPHTSAGRIPTEKGYQYYIENFVDKNKKIKDIKGFKDIKTNDDIKDLAKLIAEESGLAVFVGFGAQDVYYTGLSNLFSQAEFQDLDMVFNITAVLEHLDEVMQNIYTDFSEKLQIKIGQENPFSQNCSVVALKSKNILFGILGPMRMDYQKSIELINLIKNYA